MKMVKERLLEQVVLEGPFSRQAMRMGGGQLNTARLDLGEVDVSLSKELSA